MKSEQDPSIYIYNHFVFLKTWPQQFSFLLLQVFNFCLIPVFLRLAMQKKKNIFKNSSFSRISIWIVNLLMAALVYNMVFMLYVFVLIAYT